MTCTIVQCVGGWEGQRAESCCCHFGSRTLRATLKSCDHGVVIMESTQAVPSEGGGRCRAQFCVVATSRSQRRRRPLSGTVLRCRDKPFPAKGAAAVGHSFALSRQAVPSEGGGRCRAQFCVVATSRSQRRGRPLSGTLCGVATSRSQRRGRPLSGTVLRCRDKPFPAKGAAAVGHVVRCRDKPFPAKGAAAVGHQVLILSRIMDCSRRALLAQTGCVAPRARWTLTCLPRTSSRVDWNLFEYFSLLVSLLPCIVVSLPVGYIASDGARHFAARHGDIAMGGNDKSPGVLQGPWRAAFSPTYAGSVLGIRCRRH